MATALLRKGPTLDCFANPSETASLEFNAAKFVLVDVPISELHSFPDYYTTADCSGIIAVLHDISNHQTSSKRHKKLKTVSERTNMQRHRVHEVLVPKIVNEWMGSAPGFDEYCFSLVIRDQTQDVWTTAKHSITRN